MLELIEALIEAKKMLLGGIFGLVGAGMHQLQMYLQGGVAQQSGKLGFRCNLGGHQVQQNDLQGTDILGNRPVLGHYKNILLLQDIHCRKIVGNLNRQSFVLQIGLLRYSNRKWPLCQSPALSGVTAVPKLCLYNNASVSAGNHFLFPPWHWLHADSYRPDVRNLLFQ